MSQADLYRRAILLSLVLAALVLPIVGCAPADRICTANTKAECDPLYEIAESLHSPAMERAIAEARK